MDDQRKNRIDPKRPLQRNHPKQLHAHNMPTINVEILTAQIREEIYESLTSHRLFSE